VARSSGLDNQLEELRRVTAATLRALSGHPQARVEFVRGEVSMRGGVVSLPTPPRKPATRDVAQVRGEADAMAFRLKYHNPAIHGARAPADPFARSLFDAIEQARCEALGARRFTGVANNLDAALEQRCATRGFGSAGELDPVDLPMVLGMMVRQTFTGKSLPKVAASIVEPWNRQIAPVAACALVELKQTMSDQANFAGVVAELLQRLGFNIEPNLGEDSPEQDDASGRETGTAGTDSAGESGVFEAAAGKSQTSSAKSPEVVRKHFSMPRDCSDVELRGEAFERARRRAPNDASMHGRYAVYRREFDEVVHAEDLVDEGELSRLRLHLDGHLVRVQGVILRLANRLQRRLMAKQARHWEFDLEEGLLDTARIARVVANPLHSLSYKCEQETDFRDTIVTLLIDNSGSMRGRPITIAAISADILARTLERCGVKAEILGFTTRAWKGGRVREHWLEQGRPASPGRLNELRHIIYKKADTPWRRARKNLGLMLRDSVLKENIDGEALLWAHQRLLARCEQRRILMVISDGTPVDDATLSANPPNYLDRHLREVIDYVERRSPVELLAIGIGHDVTRYYRRAVTLVDAEQLGDTMMKELATLFDVSPARRRAVGNAPRAGVRLS
jgi:cobaltochelatase CobT